VTATLELHRPAMRTWKRDALRTYRILVDDREVTRLKTGQAHVGAVEPGSHRVEARVGWFRRSDLPINVADGQVLRIAVWPDAWSVLPAHDPDAYVAVGTPEPRRRRRHLRRNVG
jgi:hypothetical protein